MNIRGVPNIERGPLEIIAVFWKKPINLLGSSHLQRFLSRTRSSSMPKKLDPFVSYATNGQYIWTNHDPDLELIEPPILVSINRNRLKFGHKPERPPVSHTFMMVNHGEYPVAFKVMTTDNFIYFVDQKYGIIPGRSLNCCKQVRMPNAIHIEVSRRPYGCIAKDNATPYYNIPKKDRLFVLLAPAHSFSIPPATYFHTEMGYEKLRVCLEFTAEPPLPSDVTGLYKKAGGWCTWNTKTNGPLCSFPDVKQPKKELSVPMTKPAENKKKRGQWGPLAASRNLKEAGQALRPKERLDVSTTLERTMSKSLDQSRRRIALSALKLPSKVSAKSPKSKRKGKKT